MPGRAWVGRVGAFAVALGVGAAIMTGWGGATAWADESASSRSTAANDATGDSAGDSAGDAHTPQTAGPGVVTGGTADAADDAVETDEKKPDGRVDASPRSDDGLTDKPAAKRSSRQRAGPTERKRSASMSVAANTGPGDDAKDTTTVEHMSPPVEKPAASRIATPPEAPATVVSTPRYTSASVPVERPRLPVVVMVSRLVSDVVSSILNPFAASRLPKLPVDMPAPWSLLAFARREFENAFTPRRLSDKPAIPVEVSAVEPEQRTLILTAFPAEADAILARTTLDPHPTVVVDGRHFYLGSMGGKKVIVAMTGIGMVNATRTTETALAHFTPESGIAVNAVVFSGVAGGFGRTQIGSVAVPARWTPDDGQTWHTVDADMLATAGTLDVDLDSTARLGNPTCLCGALGRLPLVDLGREPQLFVGGDGSSDDNNNGLAFPAIPFGGDVFGPQPCLAPDRSLLFTGNFFQALGPFLAGGLLSNLTGLLAPVVPPVDAVDQETAAAQQVADAHGVPFLGIRGMSDGPGDPLNLPGYPFTFFVYKQVAADNAAAVTEAFLQRWDDGTNDEAEQQEQS